MAVQGKFYGLPVATLTAMMTNFTNALTAVATTGQSYSIAGRTFTRANLTELSNIIAEIQAALNRANGTANNQTYPQFGSPYPGT